LLAKAESTLPSDARWGNVRGCPLPWAFCWSGNIGISRDTIERSNLYFDESFNGWGGEDLEWAYRAHLAGARIEFLPEAWGVHLPHERNVGDQIASEQENFRRLLALHPCFDVEMVVWLNDLEANSRYEKIVSAVTQARGSRPLRIMTNEDEIRFGADEALPGGTTLNLLGVATPFPAGSFDKVSIAPWMRRLPSDIRDALGKEAARVCRTR
jgi:hypothetical protein